jgi:hypothetical protein
VGLQKRGSVSKQDSQPEQQQPRRVESVLRAFNLPIVRSAVVPSTYQNSYAS